MTKRKRGRPPEGDDNLMAPITVRFPPAMVDEIRKIQSGSMSRPTQGQIIRDLVALALVEQKKRK